jgi:hypothetical protein
LGKISNSVKNIPEFTEDTSKYPYGKWENKLRRTTKKNPKKIGSGPAGGRHVGFTQTDTEFDRRYNVPAGEMHGFTDGHSYSHVEDGEGLGLGKNLGADEIDYLLKQRNYLLNNPTMGGESNGMQTGEIVKKLDLILSRMANTPENTEGVYGADRKSQNLGRDGFNASDRSLGKISPIRQKRDPRLAHKEGPSNKRDDLITADTTMAPTDYNALTPGDRSKSPINNRKISDNSNLSPGPGFYSPWDMKVHPGQNGADLDIYVDVDDKNKGFSPSQGT